MRRRWQCTCRSKRKKNPILPVFLTGLRCNPPPHYAIADITQVWQAKFLKCIPAPTHTPATYTHRDSPITPDEMWYDIIPALMLCSVKVDFKAGRLSRWAWSDHMNLLKAESFLQLIAERQVKEIWSLRRTCCYEDGRSHPQKDCRWPSRDKTRSPLMANKETEAYLT